MTSSSLQTALQRRRNLVNRKFLGPASLFFGQFLKHPTMIGSIIPSSSKLIDRMLSRVDWDNVKIFVEYGPGVGTFTVPILERLKPDARLIAIDTNEDFIDYLAKDIVDPRFILVHGSAVDVRTILKNLDIDHADYVISGLPFSTLPPNVGDQIVAATHDVLAPGATFVVYQYGKRVMRLLNRYFSTIEKGFELLNIPPAQVFWAIKTPQGETDA